MGLLGQGKKYLDINFQPLLCKLIINGMSVWVKKECSPLAVVKKVGQMTQPFRETGRFSMPRTLTWTFYRTKLKTEELCSAVHVCCNKSAGKRALLYSAL